MGSCKNQNAQPYVVSAIGNAGASGGEPFGQLADVRVHDPARLKRTVTKLTVSEVFAMNIYVCGFVRACVCVCVCASGGEPFGH